MVDFTNDYQFFVERLDKITDAHACLDKLIHQETYLVHSIDLRLVECRTALLELRNDVTNDIQAMLKNSPPGTTPDDEPMDDGFLIGLLDHPLVKSGRIKITISNTSADEL